MKINYILIIFFSLFQINICAFINSEYIKDLSSISEFDAELKKTNITTGMMLIYSIYCGHCHHFLSTYESLAKRYNNQLLFYAMNVYSDYHKRMPRTWGVPYILFFSEGYFYPFKSRRSYAELSATIENNYLIQCKYITYKNIENVYYNFFMQKKQYDHLIIGFFDQNEKESIKNFREENKKLIEENNALCYVCNDFNENKNKNESLFKYVENKIIVGYLRNNISKIFLWNNKDKDNNYYYNYEKFIKEDLKSDYIDINEENKKYLINFLRNRNNLIFSYKANEEKIKFIDYINNIKNIDEYKKTNFVLYNFSIFEKNVFSYINESGLFEINGELNFINKFKNYDKLNEKMFKGINKTNLNSITNNNNGLLIPDVSKENSTEDDNDESDETFNFDLFFEVLEKICVVLFTIVLTFAVFFFNYNRYYKKVDQNILNYYSNQK